MANGNGLKASVDKSEVIYTRLVSLLNFSHAELKEYLQKKKLGKAAGDIVKDAKNVLGLAALCNDCLTNYDKSVMQVIDTVEEKTGIQAFEFYNAFVNYSKNPTEEQKKDIIHTNETLEKIIKREDLPDESIESAMRLFERTIKNVIAKYVPEKAKQDETNGQNNVNSPL